MSNQSAQQQAQAVIANASATSAAGSPATGGAVVPVIAVVPATSTGGSPPVQIVSPSGGGSSSGSGINLLHAIAGVILAIGAVIWYTTDTPPRRAEIEREYIAADVRKQELKVLGASAPRVIAPVSAPVFNVEEKELKVGMQYEFPSGGVDVPVAVISMTTMPESVVGVYKLIPQGSMGTNFPWHSGMSPMLHDVISYPGVQKMYYIYTQGPVIFTM